MYMYNVGKTVISHSPFHLFLGGIAPIPKWVVYGIVLTTLYGKS